MKELKSQKTSEILMKILFVLENYLPHIGGVEIVFKNLIHGLVKEGHDVTVLTHRLPNTPKTETIEGAKIIRVGCLNSRYLFSFAAIPKAIKLAKKADIIHATTFNGAPPAWIASLITKKPVLLTVHEVWINRWRELTELGPISGFIHDILERLIYIPNYTHYATVSNSTKKMLLERNIKESKVTTVYNGLDYELWDPKKYNKESLKKKLGWNTFTYFCSGRPGVSKGIEYAVKAAALVEKELPDAQFVLMMSKDEEYQERYEHIKEMIKELQIKNITLLDPVPYDKIPELVSAADAMIVPSVSEGFGFTAAEASALGTPVVASNTTSLPEVVSNKFILTEPRNPESIAKAIISVSNKKYNTKPLKKFTWKENVDNYLEIYKKINYLPK
jgi:glycosyltransferase involved in cell wall biosynthesis